VVSIERPIRAISYAVVGGGNLIANGALNNLCPECCYYSIFKGAQNPPSCWIVREEAFSAFATSYNNTQLFFHPNGAVNFLLAIGKKVTNSQ
jgi:hypothetical protein